jgi:hypothetical protein
VNQQQVTSLEIEWESTAPTFNIRSMGSGTIRSSKRTHQTEAPGTLID